MAIERAADPGRNLSGWAKSGPALDDVVIALSSPTAMTVENCRLLL